MKNLSMRDAFFDALYEIAKKDRNVIIVSADMGAPSLDKFRETLPSQFINVGIAEENMVTVATGLALEGKKVYLYAIMPFVTMRCYEMIKVDMSLMNIPITAVGVGAGFGYDDSGPTHHSTEDITIMRTLPNMTVLNSTDSVLARALAGISYRLPGPSYVRLDRETLPALYSENYDFSDGLKRFKDGEDVCIISTGNMVHTALEVSDMLAGETLKAGVIDLYRLKPVNKQLLMKELENSERIVTLEEHLLAGGLGGMMAEMLCDVDNARPLKRIGIEDKYYYAYGGRKNIQSLCGIDAPSVARRILSWIRNKNGVLTEGK